MDNENLKYLYFLTKVDKLGNVRINSLINSFPDFKSIFNLSKSKLSLIPGINTTISENILSLKSKFTDLDSEFKKLLDNCKKNDIKIITILDEDYPRNLKLIFDAPILLFVKGKLKPEDIYSIAIIGTRYPSEYGKNICVNIAKELSKLKLPIVSGMARGIDSISHKVSLENNNFTYAVLGSGANVIYPLENKNLYDKIIQNGAIISELEPNAKPDKVNFPRRNRIISGISIGTLIVESGIKGGSLITAEFALDQNKEIFAIPGSVFSKKSEGTNNLIKKGTAKLITNVDDILCEIEYKVKDYLKGENNNKQKSKPEIDLNVFEKKLFDVINDSPLHIDEISSITELNISDCLVNLLSLEFKELIRQLPGKYFVKV